MSHLVDLILSASVIDSYFISSPPCWCLFLIRGFASRHLFSSEKVINYWNWSVSKFLAPVIYQLVSFQDKTRAMISCIFIFLEQINWEIRLGARKFNIYVRKKASTSLFSRFSLIDVFRNRQREREWAIYIPSNQSRTRLASFFSLFFF